ncbi:formyl transferase [Patescibacteria group bacterium]|nr:formyl transferase [Patescibacteria group bacterium]
MSLSYKLIYNSKEHSGPMRLAGFMSGSGTNIIKILEKQRECEKREGRDPFQMIVIFTDTKDEQKCQAKAIARREHIPYICHDILDFYKKRGHKNKKDLSLRPLYDSQTVEELKDFKIDLIALGGYMSVITRPLLKAYPNRIINVHPANLLIKEGERRKYTGAHAVAKAIRAGEKYLYSSTHIVKEKVDYGNVLMVSQPMKVELPKDISLEYLIKEENLERFRQVVQLNQKRLKEAGDWLIFPKTLKMISQGRFGIDDSGRVYVDGKLCPEGYQYRE